LALTFLARIDEVRGDHEHAREQYQHALDIWTAHHGPDHPRLIWPHNCLGRVALHARDYVVARRHYTIGVTLAERSFGADHPDVAWALFSLGELELAAGDHAEAIRVLTRALDIWTRVHGSAHPYLAHALTGMGEANLALGRLDTAQGQLERALQLRAPERSSAYDRGQTQFALARALSRRDADDLARRRARQLATQAHASFVEAGPEADVSRDCVGAWLAAVERGAQPSSRACYARAANVE
jgi:tetratricopeptide (TPR) repeat protein